MQILACESHDKTISSPGMSCVSGGERQRVRKNREQVWEVGGPLG